MTKATDYLKETKAEMKHVNWPTRKQSIAFTAIVIGITIAFALYLGVFDYLFTLGLETLVQ
ncbi:MAG TPA: preprotein translocase subunit SecE [Candidatus Paceibacterota bacterium]